MNPVESVQDQYLSFMQESRHYPEIQKCMDRQFVDCLLSPRLGCQVARDVLPFCGRVLSITKIVYSEKDNNNLLYKTWKCVLEYLHKNSVAVERYALPPTELRFPLSRAVMNGKNITFDKVSFLDASNTDNLEKLIKKATRFTSQVCGFSVFSETSLRMMLKGSDTLCAYSVSEEGKITSIAWGVKLLVKNTHCFYMLFAAREPEYAGQGIYGKMIESFQPKLTQEGPFKSDFLCWKQGKGNKINNQAIDKFQEDLERLTRTDSNPYSFEEAENCSIRLSSDVFVDPPNYEDLDKALLAYAFKVGDVSTFAWELPFLMFKVGVAWNVWYRQQFPIPDGYQTSLQAIK